MTKEVKVDWMESVRGGAEQANQIHDTICPPPPMGAISASPAGAPCARVSTLPQKIACRAACSFQNFDHRARRSRVPEMVLWNPEVTDQVEEFSVKPRGR